MSEVLTLLQVADTVLAALQRYRIGAETLAAMQAQNADGRLTKEQIEQLADKARSSVERLG
jgi:hypothetical protein